MYKKTRKETIAQEDFLIILKKHS